MSRLRNYLLLFLALTLVSGLAYGVLREPREKPVDFPVVATTTTALPSDFKFEIADTEAKRVQGLSGRADIPDDYGMLFVFPKPGDYGFWMKDMLVSIDIIWLDEDGVVLGVTDSVSPDSFPKTFHPPSLVSYVLEVRAGYAKERGITRGTKLSLPIP